MSTAGRLQAIIAEYRQQLADQEAHAVHLLETMYAHTLKIVQSRLAAIYQRIEEAEKAGEKVPISYLYEQHRLDELKAFIVQQMTTYSHLVEQQVINLQTHASSAGVQSAFEQLKALTPKGIHWTWGMPSPSAIVSMVGATAKGSPLRELFQGFGEEAAASVARALVTSITLGENPRKTARYVEDALDVSRSRALTLCRTEQLRSYRMGNMETYRKNDNAVEQWRWTCAKSSRTCVACISMDGSLHDLTEEMGSHPNCRCSPTPVTKSWDEILGPLGIDTSNLPDTRPNIQPGAEWFEHQDAETQRKIIGSQSAYELYKSGDYDLNDFVGINHSKEWGHSIYQRSVKQITKGA